MLECSSSRNMVHGHLPFIHPLNPRLSSCIALAPCSVLKWQAGDTQAQSWAGKAVGLKLSLQLNDKCQNPLGFWLLPPEQSSSAPVLENSFLLSQQGLRRAGRERPGMDWASLTTAVVSATTHPSSPCVSQALQGVFPCSIKPDRIGLELTC